MSGLIRMSFNTPEETRSFKDGRGHVDMINLAASPLGRAVFQPGWRWSVHVKPIAGTETCEAAHAGYCVSGQMKIVMNDGQEETFGPGDVMICPPGHDAWVVGDEPCVVIDWQGFADYAKG